MKFIKKFTIWALVSLGYLGTIIGSHTLLTACNGTTFWFNKVSIPAYIVGSIWLFLNEGVK